MPTLKAIHICNSHKPTLQPKIAKEYVFANADRRPKKNTERTTAVLQKWRFSASNDSEVVGSSSVLRMKFSGENRHLRKAAKRCATPYENTA
jgi:hypothetical protein